MAGAAYPKPDDEKITRVKSDFTWTDLPERNEAPVPPLPKLKSDQEPWSELALDKWNLLWTSPQSTQWTREMYTLVEQWLYLYESFTEGDYSGATVSGMARIENRLGLDPKSMLQMRWRIRGEATHPAHPAHPAGGGGLASVSSLPKRRSDPRLG